MKKSDKFLKIATLAAGVSAIVCALLTAVFLILSALGAVKTRKDAVTLGTLDKSAVYSGQVLEGNEPYIVYGKLREGHNLVCLGIARRTEPGTQENSPKYVIVDEAGTDVTGTYDVTEKWGELTVKKRPLIFSTTSANKMYDGTPLSESGVHKVSGALLSGHTVSASCITEITEVGTAANDAVVCVTDADGNDVTEYYEATVNKGVLEVKPVPIYLKTSAAEKIYDGKPLTNEDWEITEGTFFQGDKITPVMFSSITNAGTVKNTITFKVTDKHGKDVSGRYDFIFSQSYLRVLPIRLVIETGSAEKTYDGTALTCDDWRLVSGELPEGHRLEVVCSSRTEVGVSQNTVVGFTVYKKLPDGKETDVTECFIYSYVPGTLTVIP